jgi:hypothetical protein
VTRAARTGSVAGAALVGVVLVALLPSAARAAPFRISVFGDSVLLGASEEIAAGLAGNDVSVDAHEDMSLLGSLGTLTAARPSIGDVVVLDYGYNDGTDLGAWRDRIDQAMAILNGVPRVIWLDQREFAAGRAQMNAELRAAVARYPNLDVVDWNAAVAAHPEYVYSDGIHLTPTGQDGMADLVRARVAAFAAERTAALAPSTTTPPPTTQPSTTAPTTDSPTVESPTGGPQGSAAGVGAQAGNGGGSDAWWIAAVTVAGVLAVVGAVLVRRRAGARAP